MINFSLLSRHMALCMLVGLSPLMASEIQKAKEAGKACELPNGKVMALAKDDSTITALVDSTNQKRLANYQEIANGNGTPLEEVGKVAAKEIAELHPNQNYRCP
jgi:uncharacterized protein YdbL (DUF1318 family)